MALRAWVSDARAVSPVVGTVLMVAIVVILAAIIAAFALGIGAPQKAPAASLQMLRANDSALCLSHEGGDSLTLALSRTRLFVDGAEDTDYSAPSPTFRAGQAQVLSNLALETGTKIVFIDAASSQRIATFEVQRLESGTLVCP